MTDSTCSRFFKPCATLTSVKRWLYFKLLSSHKLPSGLLNITMNQKYGNGHTFPGQISIYFVRSVRHLRHEDFQNVPVFSCSCTISILVFSIHRFPSRAHRKCQEKFTFCCVQSRSKPVACCIT